LIDFLAEKNYNVKRMELSERGAIQNFIQTKLETFVDKLEVEDNCDILVAWEKNAYYKKLADEVNAELLANFDCLEDFKIITLVTALRPQDKVGGLANAAVWSASTDVALTSQYSSNQVLFSLASHFIFISGDEESDDEPE